MTRAGQEEEEPEDIGSRCALLRALSDLSETDKDYASEVEYVAAKALSPTEIKALEAFELEAQKCLAKLTGATIVNLGRLGAGNRAFAVGRTDMVRKTKSTKKKDAEAPAQDEVYTTSTIYELFEKFDKNKDGLLEEQEFKQAFRELAGSEEVSDEQLDLLLKSADVNTDGFVDIHEFTVWLYGIERPGTTQGKEEKGEKRKKEEDDSAELQKLRQKAEQLERELRVKTTALARLDEAHEEEMETTHDFWREIAKHAVLTIDKKVDLQHSKWLGNGKYGFVFKARRLEDNREVVVKMMGTRWAHLAVQEWKQGAKLPRHPNLVEYEDVMLHSDNDLSITKLLKQGYESGELKSRVKRTTFPDRYICLTQEFMNRGTVQDWLDQKLLLPSGLLQVARDVAAALGFMHGEGVTHNDIKPENIMLHEDDHHKVHVKLGDLGLAKKSKDCNADFWQYGMTLFCMLSGERFGTRKYRQEDSAGIVKEAEQAVEEANHEEKWKEKLGKLPKVMDMVFSKEAFMVGVATLDVFQEEEDLGMLAMDQTGLLRDQSRTLDAKSLENTLRKVD